MIRVLMIPALAILVHVRADKLNVEIVALNLFTNYFNLVANAENNFPFVTAAAETSAAQLKSI